MSSWEGFTTRLRKHADIHTFNKTTRGYLLVAADRIEDLEAKLAKAEREVRVLQAARVKPL